jgi:TRAP-type C4-dicarboxylate transport system substrate-binding protein
MLKNFQTFKPLLLILFILFITDTALAVRLKIATLTPEGSMWMEKMRKGAVEVAKETNNRVQFKFYPGGVMGDDKAVLRKIRIGQLHGGAVVSGSLSRFFPANQLYAQPMKFKNIEEVDYVRQYMDQYIIDGLEKAGFITFGLIGGGFAYIMSQQPVETLKDLKKQKVWMPDNDKISHDSIKAFGISPITLPISDVRTALQSGLINTVATSPVGAIVLQWHTQIRYVTNIPLIYLHAVLAIDKKKFSKIAEQDKKITEQIMTKAMKEIGIQNKKDNFKAIQALKNQGITFINPSQKNIDEWHSAARNASEKMVDSGVLPQKIVNQMNRHLADFHSKTQNDSDQ